jgi:UDP-N-acetylmuramyl pentapeptide phosphotransferase/UDP-N-acetylglucosamine-1-phosphate transferase
MHSLAIALLVSFFVAGLIVRLARTGSGLGSDDDLSGVQKVHAHPVPRVGGFAIAVALWLVAGWVAWRGIGPAREFVLVLACGLPPLLAGLLEDLTKKVGVRTRLAATALSGVLAFFLVGAQLREVQMPGLDWLMGFTAFSLLFTVVAIAGVANAVNIIDGFNGLASAVVVISLLSLAYVGWQVGDALVVSMALAGVGALLGFLLWNWPRGLIFLGDGGAYFIGYLVAVLSFILVARHRGVVSPWYPMLLFIYPVFETLFSIWRRKVVRGSSPGLPDGLHLHQLIFRRLVRWAVGRRDAASLTLRNSLTAPYLWLLSSLAAIPATLFWRQPFVLIGFVAAFCIVYVWLYLRLVRFRGLRLLVLRSRAGGALSRFRDGL